MRLRITRLRDRGDLANERLVLKAGTALDIGQFLLLRVSYREESITSAVHNTFWFPDKEVAEGDLVVLYSKRGVQSAKENKSGTTTHFFYWGREEAIWGVSNRAAVLIQSRDWQSFGPDEF